MSVYGACHKLQSADKVRVVRLLSSHNH